MDQANPPRMDDDSNPLAYQQHERLPRVVVHFSVTPGITLTWRVEADTTLAVHGARLWLTRISSPYDHWLAPGDEFLLQGGERVVTAGVHALRPGQTIRLLGGPG